MFVNLSPRFKRSYKNLPRPVQTDFQTKIQIFIENPYHHALKTHKLKGRLQECLAFRLRDGYRVLFEFSSTDTVNLLDIGSHDVYKKF
jgi:addiction module RelE/StbE family toxin